MVGCAGLVALATLLREGECGRCHVLGDAWHSCELCCKRKHVRISIIYLNQATKMSSSQPQHANHVPSPPKQTPHVETISRPADTAPQPHPLRSQATQSSFFSEIMPSYFCNLLDLLRSKRQRRERQIRRQEKLARRDHERRTEGLLRLALRNNNSINSFTAADPGVFYRANREEDPWRRKEGGMAKPG